MHYRQIDLTKQRPHCESRIVDEQMQVAKVPNGFIYCAFAIGF
jgi:hypothetical protein